MLRQIRSIVSAISKTRQSTIFIAVELKKIVQRAKTLNNSLIGQIDKTEEASEMALANEKNCYLIGDKVEALAKKLGNVAWDSQQNSVKLADSVKTIDETESAFVLADSALIEILDGVKKAEKLTALIEKIAKQTTLLSFNAATEAARLGSTGAGFNVIAREIKYLADESAKAVLEVSGTVSNIRDVSSSTKKKMEKTGESLHKARGLISQLDEHSKVTTAGMMESSRELNHISAAMAQMAEKSKKQRELIGDILDAGKVTQKEMTMTAEVMTLLTIKTEQLQYMTADVRLKEKLDDVVKYGLGLKAKLEKHLAELKKQQINVLDREYQKVTGSRPEKYSTHYDTHFDKRVRSLYDKALSDLNCLFYCNALDINGYVPAHNSKYSAALTGNYETDLANSRSKRIMTDEASQRAVKHQQQFFLQTYLRDNGDIVTDVSFPLFVAGTHWGGLRLGVDSTKLVKE